MKRKKLLVEPEISELVFSDEKIKISKNGEKYFFETSNGITSDLAEAVSMMMRVVDNKSGVWNVEIENYEECDPEKSLYWLSGGRQEWNSLDNYNRPWCDCYLDFQEEFGILILGIIKKSKKLSDIRDYFNKYLSLPVLYDFAISKSFVR